MKKKLQDTDKKYKGHKIYERFKYCMLYMLIAHKQKKENNLIKPFAFQTNLQV